MHKLLLATIVLCTVITNFTYTMNKSGLRNRSAWQNNDSDFPLLSSSSSSNTKTKKGAKKQMQQLVLKELINKSGQRAFNAQLKREQQKKMNSVIHEIVDTVPLQETLTETEFEKSEELEQEIPLISLNLQLNDTNVDDAQIEYGPELPATPHTTRNGSLSSSSNSVEREAVQSTKITAAAEPVSASQVTFDEKTSVSISIATPERPISFITKTWHARSDHMTFALALFNNKEGTKKEVGHQIDRAIEYVNEQLETIAKSKKQDSIQAVEEIIELQKPHINNLQKLLELTQTNQIQALEKSLTLAWRTINNHNKLRIKRAALVCKDDIDVLKKNKIVGSTILDLKYEKSELDGEISDEEYTEFAGLFDKIATEMSK